ncbi:hypothetical protein BT93_L3758 [Corymbia citriodora subsp. variegata]|uniref:Uncharacterized protein n=1 Tax=Corymbia citriodora subsp. variegata TaxID=360336 RepID=A0A8T0CGQ8_CORYI|nr:hypothetical protein BT93_L3758 [Corymbia citriodora subsp. variegata]
MMEVSVGQSTARVVNDRVYVAVGRDVQESKSTLDWALVNFGDHFRIIHVHQPHQLNPSREYSGSKMVALPS